VADFLGEGQTDAGDAIGNMKRLLQLLADKSKQQSRQIQSLEIEKEKLDHLNVCEVLFFCGGRGGGQVDSSIPNVRKHMEKWKSFGS
jgi:hypothetical protein